MVRITNRQFGAHVPAGERWNVSLYELRGLGCSSVDLGCCHCADHVVTHARTVSQDCIGLIVDEHEYLPTRVWIVRPQWRQAQVVEPCRAGRNVTPVTEPCADTDLSAGTRVEP
jgi:hypothetical protein